MKHIRSMAQIVMHTRFHHVVFFFFSFLLILFSFCVVLFLFQLHRKYLIVFVVLFGLTVYFNVVHTNYFKGAQNISSESIVSDASGKKSDNAVADAASESVSKYGGKEEIHMDPLLPAEQPDIRYPEPYYCYHKNTADLKNVDLLEDLVLSKRQPKDDKAIFFVISSCFEHHRVEIRKR